MHNRRNYYRILHVQPDAPDAIIKASYRALMQKLKMHPDLGGDDWNAAMLNEAYAALSDPDRRAAYDKALRQTAQGPGPGADIRKTASACRKAPSPTASSRRQYDSCCPFCQSPHPPDFHYLDPAVCPGCSSPLQAASHPGLAGSMQRAMQRRKHSGAMRFFTSPKDPGGCPGLIRDLSPAGMLFASPVKIPIKRIIRIDSDVIAATARITHCLKGTSGPGYLIGGAFLTLRFFDHRGTFLSENA